MPIENDKGPGGVDAAYGKRTTLPARNYDVTKKYGDTFREDGDGPVNHIIKEDENGNLGIGTSNPLYDVQIGEYGVDTDSTLALATTNTGTGTIRFGDGTSGPNANSGRIQYDHATDNMNFWTNSSERMRIDSLGNVGIGTASPNRPLTINNSTSQIQFVNSTTGTGSSDGLTVGMGGAASADAYINQQENANLIFNTNATERMRIDASGNVGVGVTPSSWSAAYKALQVGNSAAIWSNATGTTESSFSTNVYYDGSYRYKNSAAATRYDQFAGSHIWHTAPSGTAGNAITFTQAMTLDTNGNLGLSVAPSNWVGYKAFEFGPGNALWGSNTNSSFLSTNLYWDGAFKYKGAFPASYYQQSAGEHRWFTAPTGTANAAATVTQRMTLDVNGNLGIGTTSPAKPVDAVSVASDAVAIRVRGRSADNIGNLEFTSNDGTTSYGVVQGRGGSELRIVSNGATFISNYTNGFERMRIDASGNVLVTGSGGLGYGTGSGGTVTQLTSKSTAVTLNKPSGQITMNNAALAAGVAVTFDVNCAAVTATDVPMVVLKGGNASSGTYQVWVDGVFNGQFKVTVRNISGGSLSEALVLNYSIIKGATS